ncbi:hypothetical protein [uncultured Salipiger sp.]|uniref:hypothetical protein n=1 Tax=uncultured Salipiger sp. TaxID=499810 RepID=UPI0025968D51|nr:hypothetical protein [uncultured Salipiger sp.]
MTSRSLLDDLLADLTAEGDALPAGASLRDALSACLASGREAVAVTTDDGAPGRVTLDAIRRRGELA